MMPTTTAAMIAKNTTTVMIDQMISDTRSFIVVILLSVKAEVER